MSQTSKNNPVNPNEYLEIPKWINEDYFRPIIEMDFKDFVNIKNFATIAATQPGENYNSIMVRVLVDVELKDGSERQTSYILKTTMEADKGGKLQANLGFFPKEKQMYEVHIPNFIKLYKEADVDIELAPKCLHVGESPEGITLVLEDLKRQNFQNVDRLQGLDMDHMRQVLRKLAELHAASAVNYEQNGPYDEMFQLGLYKESNRHIFEESAKLRQEQLVRAMREWPLVNVEKYINTFPSPSNYVDNALKLNKVDENDFNCLNHGDAWCNNILFSGNRTLFVDLQIGKWGSPAQDLWYLITTSASLDIKVKEFDHFIKIYHERLVECLKLLKYSKHIPSLTELHITMLKHGNWGILTAISFCCMILMPTDKDASLSLLLKAGPEGDAYRYKSYTNPYYVRTLVQLYPFLENKGLLQ